MARVTIEARIEAKPRPFVCDPRHTALLVIDMQHDFCSPGGYVDHSGADVAMLRKPIDAIQAMLQAARRLGMTVIYTREGHRPDLADCPAAKLERTQWVGHTIGKKGPLGRLLVRGEPGNAIIDELAPLAHETVIDKTGKSGFYGTELDVVLRARQITHLLFTGVTTHICVESTMREAADRGFWNLVVSDGTAAITDALHAQALDMIMYQGGVFGVVAPAREVCRALAAVTLGAPPA
jgi:nicotinamidase-related amidase